MKPTSRAAPRVLMVLENNPYPQDVRVHAEALALATAGHNVSVIAPALRRAHSASQPWHETIERVRVYRYPAPASLPGAAGYLWEYGYSMVATFIISLFVLLTRGFDVLHVANPPDTFVFIAAFYKLLGKRFVYDHHDLAPEMYLARFGDGSNSLVYRVLVSLEKLSCRLADHVIATNLSYKAVEMKRGKVPEGRITIVRNGPDLERLTPGQPDPDLRRKGKTIICYAGVMGMQDGLDYLLRVLRHLVSDLGRTDFLCVLVGGGDALPGLRSMAEQWHLTDYTLFTGWIERGESNRYVNYLSTADICVAPEPSNFYNDHSTMLKIMEYMAQGKPIVAFDLPEHRFTAQAAALYAPANDEAAFAWALAELMDDPARRQEMGAYGRCRVETDLAWCHSVPNLLKAYQGLGVAAKNKGGYYDTVNT